MLENLHKIEVQSPVDLIITQIRNLISTKQVLPGDKLPSERKLAEHLGVSRGNVRAAISKLEFYGIVKVHANSGTRVTGLGIPALEGLITDILAMENVDFGSLVDTRILLEKEATRLAAIKRTDQDLKEIKTAMLNYENKLMKGEQAVEEDLLFHIKIAEASKNSVLKSLMLIITPDIVKNFINLKVCDESNNRKTIEEHRQIIDMISTRDADQAEKAMTTHLEAVKAFSQNFKP